VKDLVEDGTSVRTYVVLGVIDGVVEGEEWWHSTCKCHRSVTSDTLMILEHIIVKVV